MYLRYFNFIIILTILFHLCILNITYPQNLDSEKKKTYKELVSRWGEAVSNHNFEKMSELMSVDYIWHFPSRDIIGWENVKISFENLFKAFPDLQLIPEEIIVDNNKVVVRWKISGTHRGEFLGVKPTNKLIHYSSISMDRVVGGKFIEGWEIYDELGLREQLGFEVIPNTEFSKTDTTEPKIRELHSKYMEASNNHDYETLASMTADSAVWLLGRYYRFEGKDEVLQPHRLDEGANTSLEYSSVMVRGDTVEFVLVERNDILDALGIPSMVHYPRFIFKDGRVMKKEPWKRIPELSNENGKIHAAFQKWVREEKSEERAKFIDPDGNLIFKRESGIIMTRLAKEWAAIQAIKQIHKLAAKAVEEGDVATYINLFTEDGIYMWPGVPTITGQEALRTWFKNRFINFSAKLDKTIEETVVLGDWAFERGREKSNITNRLSGEMQIVRGKFINIFQKNSNGDWKIARRIRNLDHPMQSIK